ncbi:helix-turn-helix domain-containing protein [Streptomyces murinus]|uniref:helix-turn-helix transcriptional regulator n=1 Tax=Streptomyces murinus TaxID=33900 RepID=UPI000A1EEF52|nr:helix-turn-helix domain-containing protein [Streptomyces murinus]WDO04642.1 helix-turn-helix domain-containing protein [Streptomyces murinus]
MAESPRRRAVLDVLRAAPAPLGVTETAERLGVHPNTVRFHLDALVAEGLVERRAEASTGPGRPRTVYTVRPGMDRGGARGYLLLARMLLSRWTSADPAEAREQARETGREWGRFLVDPLPPFERPTAQRSVTRLLALLADLGFEPEPAAGATPESAPGPAPESAPGAVRESAPGPAPGTADENTPERIRLRHCPFLELAEEHGALICPLHLGLIQGALDRLDAPLTATRLEPFAEPDSCYAHLSAAGFAPRDTREGTHR